MGMNAILMILQTDADQAQFEKVIRENVLPIVSDRNFAVCLHDISPHPFQLCSIEMTETLDIVPLGVQFSSALKTIVWIIAIFDSAGLEACWRYESGKCDFGAAMNLEDSDPWWPPFKPDPDPIRLAFEGHALQGIDRRQIEDLLFLDGPIYDLYAGPATLSAVRANSMKVNVLAPSLETIRKRWWEFWK